ncbi:MAG: GntR family transcriptional regulator [Oscillospiraceae bacterium]|jgi:DNA-binding transcriptional regulator YhcF (GntR family)|nr:GntR family transcriptional regulator [Oscillospiraceae bacterium]
MEGKVYLGVARDLENDILSGHLREGALVPSTHQVAERYGINPATAARGVSQLTARGILLKQRGIGLFVAEGARDRLMEERREAFRTGTLKALLDEAHVLGISKRDLLAMIMSS